MNLPKVIADLVKAQDNYDSAAYAACFSESATVTDEGKTYKGRPAIRQWIAAANEKYQAVKKPLAYEELGAEAC